MKKFQVNVVFTMVGTVLVEAETREMAESLVESMGIPDLTHTEKGLSLEAEYLSDSFVVEDCRLI